jgi:hypothetical protein
MEITYPPPFDHITPGELVARTVDSVDTSTDEDRDALLTDLLYAVWGCIWAQSQ